MLLTCVILVIVDVLRKNNNKNKVNYETPTRRR